VRLLGGDPVDVDEAARVRYHAGLAVGSNGTAAVVSLARDLLLSAGISAPERFLSDLVTRSAGNAAQQGAAALTGPVRRGDTQTVRWRSWPWPMLGGRASTPNGRWLSAASWMTWSRERHAETLLAET
jgi:predicted short-subunit dehydrogenase-like oxidoreductase (DUF2520 family)